MSDSAIQKVNSFKALLQAILTAGAIIIGLSGWIVLPEKIKELTHRTKELEAKQMLTAETAARMDERLRSIQQTLERIERKQQ